jgi:hypothetical protein
MRKSVILTAFIVLFLFSETAFADYDISGKWLLDGGGYAEKGILRVKLTDEGYLDIRTEMVDEVRYVLGYSVLFRLNASRLGINAWEYKKTVDLQYPVPLPDVRPTVNDPFELPPVTVDGLTYGVVFTSITSGTVDIYGSLDVDFVGMVGIDSTSFIWKEGTEKPDISDKSSGCSLGMAWMILALPAFLHIKVKGLKLE